RPTGIADAQLVRALFAQSDQPPPVFVRRVRVHGPAAAGRGLEAGREMARRDQVRHARGGCAGPDGPLAGAGRGGLAALATSAVVVVGCLGHRGLVPPPGAPRTLRLTNGTEQPCAESWTLGHLAERRGRSAGSGRRAARPHRSDRDGRRETPRTRGTFAEQRACTSAATTPHAGRATTPRGFDSAHVNLRRPGACAPCPARGVGPRHEDVVAVFERFNDRARRVVVLAQEQARMLNHNYIGTEHFLLGLILEGEGVGALALQNLGVNLEDVRQQVEDLLGRGQQGPSGHIPFTPRAKKVLELALREALQLGHNYIGSEHLLLGLIREGESTAAQILAKLGADLSRVRQLVNQLVSGATPPEVTVSAGSTAPATSPTLDQFGTNLTQSAREGKLDPVLLRDRETERLVQVLCRRTKNNPVLIGEPGVGKTAVVEGLCQKIVKGDVPETLKDKQLYTLDLGALVA